MRLRLWHGYKWQVQTRGVASVWQAWHGIDMDSAMSLAGWRVLGWFVFSRVVMGYDFL